LLVHCDDERDQSESVADRVLELYEQGIACRSRRCLFRAAHHSADLEIELARRRIPFVKYGGLRYLEAAHVKDLLAAFRLADNPRDEMAWFRLLQLLPGVGPAKARRAIDALRDEDGRSPLARGDPATMDRRRRRVADRRHRDVTRNLRRRLVRDRVRAGGGARGTNSPCDGAADHLLL
jgi:hypothetical protein